jgi:predicted TIM-barrel fold metal-dependent hydrolase
MRTITLEEHFTTPEFLAATRKAWQSDDVLGMWDAGQEKLLDLNRGRLADMDAHGIDLQVISLSGIGMDKLDAATATSLVREANNKLADAVKAHPQRFAGFATLALHEPEKAAAELERAVRKLGFKGALLNGVCNGKFLDDPCFASVLDAAAALDVPIYLHPAMPPDAVKKAYFGGLPGNLGFLLSVGGWGWHAEVGMHCLRMIITGVFDRFPRLKIIIGHMGEALPFYIVRAEEFMGASAKRLQRPITEYFQENFYITTSGIFSLPPFLCAMQIVGADRIMYSVDYPFSSAAAGKKFLETIPVSEDDRAKISHRNAERLLKI